MTTIPDWTQFEYASGDFVPLDAVVLGGVNKSTTSGTFTSLGGMNAAFNLGHIKSSQTLQARLTIRTAGTMDADGVYRFKLNAQGGGSNETGGQFTVSSGSTWSVFEGSIDGPFSLREQINAEIELKSSNGTDGVSFLSGSIQFGIKVP